MKNVVMKTCCAGRKLSGIEVQRLADCGKIFYAELQKDPYGRYRSWEHCYAAFADAFDQVERGEEVDYDYLGLHLAFYLASWGMYRGSTFLLQQDYKVHVRAVEIIVQDRYRPLFGIGCRGLQEHGGILTELVAELQKHYAPIRDRVVQTRKKQGKATKTKTDDVSVVLITKILMGTLGCTPAYDQYFVQALKDFGFRHRMDLVKSVLELTEFYRKHKNTFDEARKGMLIKCDGGKTLPYPDMKFLDMMFWQYAPKDIAVA